ncbi:hypothetical protein EYF80_018638 [Liparis tanakae]|uniref:Uncharacterized protein n=1 Tax=Liparis tanakae TaxID=230148 RepID=A0A4Z2HZL9_9TELE|nr:hypothetical protein EYF80_018638 [Liparis tanakae]
MGERFSCSSTSTRFLRGRGWKKKVSPSSNGIAEENSGSSSSSPKVTLKMSPCSVWARKKNMDLVLWVAEQTNIIPRSGSSRSERHWAHRNRQELDGEERLIEKNGTEGLEAEAQRRQRGWQGDDREERQVARCLWGDRLTKALHSSSPGRGRWPLVYEFPVKSEGTYAY